MSFVSPEYFWLLLFLLAAFIKRDIFPLHLTTLGYILTFVLIVIALTRPVIQQEPIETEELLSDVILGVDLSYSMQARDIAPSRLEHAKAMLKEIVEGEHKSRFGVLAFTTNAIVLSPLTSDSKLLLHLFSGLDESLVMTRGSSIMPALRLAAKMSHAKKITLVLLTDGADERNYSSEAAFAKEHNIVVNTLMIATKAGGTLRLENGELLEDELGDIVISRENSAISALSESTGGVYTTELSEILAAIDAQRDDLQKSEVTLVQNRELFYFFVFGALVTFLIATTRLKRSVLAFLLLFGVSLDADLLDSIRDKNFLAFERGVELYRLGEYEKALGAFGEVKSQNAEVKSLLFYNMANSLIRLKEFAKAREALKKSLILSYSKEAAENLLFIKDVEEQEEMSTGQQKSPNKSELAKERENSQKSKEGGGSNMKASAASGSGSQNKGKKTQSGAEINLGNTKAKLSSKQYELINKRQVDEKKPY